MCLMATTLQVLVQLFILSNVKRSLGRVGKLCVRRLHSPNISGILGDGSITGELTRCGNVIHTLLSPQLWVLEVDQNKVEVLRSISSFTKWGKQKISLNHLLYTFTLLSLAGSCLDTILNEKPGIEARQLKTELYFLVCT